LSFWLRHSTFVLQHFTVQAHLRRCSFSTDEFVGKK
jgi:hypothetical protein